MAPTAPAGEYPVLYTFRRCPYAMRARMAISCSRTTVELREVLLRDMPAPLLECSPKGTVPVLVLPAGEVLEESLDIMGWALAAHDPEYWLPAADSRAAAETGRLLAENDSVFKPWLDRYKYAVRYPEQPAQYYRQQGEQFLQLLEQRLQQHAWLLDEGMRLADVAIFPFVRQFAYVDSDWFRGAPYPRLQQWLDRLLGSKLFCGVMDKYPQWKAGDEPVVFPRTLPR